MQKVLVIVLIVLGLVVAGEVGYLLGVKKNSLATIPSPSSISPSANICATPTPYPNHAIDYETIEGYKRLHKGILASSTATNEFRGRITELDFGSGTIGDKPFAYAFKIRIYGENNQTNAFLFSQKELPDLRVTQIVAGKEEQFYLKDLKINDYLSISLTVDLTKDLNSNFLSGKIVKLQ